MTEQDRNILGAMVEHLRMFRWFALAFSVFGAIVTMAEWNVAEWSRVVKTPLLAVLITIAVFSIAALLVEGFFQLLSVVQVRTAPVFVRALAGVFSFISIVVAGLILGGEAKINVSQTHRVESERLDRQDFTVASDSVLYWIAYAEWDSLRSARKLALTVTHHTGSDKLNNQIRRAREEMVRERDGIDRKISARRDEAKSAGLGGLSMLEKAPPLAAAVAVYFAQILFSLVGFIIRDLGRHLVANVDCVEQDEDDSDEVDPFEKYLRECTFNGTRAVHPEAISMRTAAKQSGLAPSAAHRRKEEFIASQNGSLKKIK